MKKRIIIANGGLKSQAIEIIKGLPFDDKIERHEVLIRPMKANRKLVQNAQMWAINTIIAHELGYTKDEYHDLMKEMFLLEIILRHPDDYPDVIGHYEAIEEMGADNPTGAQKVKSYMVNALTTTKLRVKHMDEYIDLIKHQAKKLGIRLPAPEDLNETST